MRTGMRAAAAALLAMIFAAAGHSAAPIGRKPVNSIDDLPRYTYAYTGDAGALLSDGARRAALLAKLKADTLATLDTYDIADRPTLKSLHGTLASIAVIENDAPTIRREVALARRYSDKELDRQVYGDAALAYADGLAAGPVDSPAFHQAFRATLTAAMAKVPWALAGDRAKANAGMIAVLNDNMFRGFLINAMQTQIDKSHEITSDALRNGLGVLQQGIAYYPLRNDMLAAENAYIAANDKPKPDIWAAREVTLSSDRLLTPVVVAIWDSGVDIGLFPGRVWTNPKESANGKDDDGNGFVDDLHGIGVDEYGRPSMSPLRSYPAEIMSRLDRARLTEQGMNDQQAGIRSDAAHAFAASAAVMAPADMKQLLEDLDHYGDYAHGTHVAGIVARDNPAIRLLPIRHDFANGDPPRRPTEETARAFAKSYADAIAYMKAAGVRVVNMSWTVNLKDEYEDQLAANGVPEAERVPEARRLFAIEAGALRDAILSAPGILFICAAGNANDSVAFEASVPASIDAPNVITVAAVDQAGNPASFTSSGPTVNIAANGFQVESYVPGGTKQRWSGTSMASPNVVNAAAKLLAVRPSLTVAQLRTLLLSTATKQGDFLLVDPRAAIAALANR